MICRRTLFYLSVLPVKWRVSFLKCIRRTPSFLHVARSFLVPCPPCFSVRQSESLGRVTDRRLWDPWKRRRIFDGSKRPCSRMGRKAETCCADCFFSLSRWYPLNIGLLPCIVLLTFIFHLFPSLCYLLHLDLLKFHHIISPSMLHTHYPPAPSPCTYASVTLNVQRHSYRERGVL